MCRKTSIILVLVMAGTYLAVQTWAQNSTAANLPKSPLAVTARTKLEADRTKAKEAYAQAMAEAGKIYLQSLEKAKAEALQKENLTEVEAIVREKKRVEEELAPQKATREPRIVAVAANKAWTDAFFVRKGQELRFSVPEGQTWIIGPVAPVGPDGRNGVKPPKSEYQLGTLMMRVGTGSPTKVPLGEAWVADRDGKLMFGPNDDRLENNSGSLTVEITIKP